MIPQLRVRTEFSFRRAYGPIHEVAKALAEQACPYAAVVDGGTWGHVRWGKALRKAGVTPGFGVELPVELASGRKPLAWALAEDTAQFYQFTSAGPMMEADWAAARGIIRFAGAALTDPEAFDYVDINPLSVLRTRDALALARKTSRSVVLTSDNSFPHPRDLDAFEAISDGRKVTPQHLLRDEAEWRRAFWMLTDDEFAGAVNATREVAERLAGVALQIAPIIQVPGDLAALVQMGKAERLRLGHISLWSDVYEQRLQRELALIAQKCYESYFIVVADLVAWAKQRMLVGPARGSSAGSLVCYLLRITEIDPLVHDLLFERFIDINRNDLPDIDIDFNDQKRELIFDYLAEKYGRECVARIGNVNTLKPRSVLAEVGKRMGIPANATFAVRNVLIEYSSGDSRYGKGLEDTLTTTKPGQDFLVRYPEAEVMGVVEGHAWHTGVHAAGVIVANVPVTSYCTVKDGVAQLDKPDAEALGLLKIDALGLRTLGVLEDSGVVTAEQLYALPLNDPEAFRIINEGKFSGVFQFEGAAQRRVAKQIPVMDFSQLDHITALARPGPLGGGATNHYINRNNGDEPVTFRHPSMERYLGPTKGVVLYQEQVMNISREIGQFSWEVVSEIRKAMSGRKGKEYFDRRGKEFVEGASRLGMPQEDAETVWSEICTFGAWGMNKSHTVSYSVISYWCAWMKAHHPIEYAAALLRNAKDDEQVIEMLRELAAEGVAYVPFDPDLSEHNWVARNGKLIGGFTNLVGIGPVKAAHYIALREAGKLTDKDRADLAKRKAKVVDLRPAHSLWADIYANPDSHNIAGRVKEFAALRDDESAVVVCQIVKRERRDENETVLLARRDGVRKEGQTQFLDVFAVDDSISKPVLLRIRPKMWAQYGEKLADRAVDGVDWLLVRGRWLEQFSMLIAEKIKCLTNSELFDAEA